VVAERLPMSFLRPKARTAEAPPPPVIEDTAAKQQEYGDLLRRRKGRASAILTKDNSAAPVTASKTLLGS
jgi:hypothetical protein